MFVIHYFSRAFFYEGETNLAFCEYFPIHELSEKYYWKIDQFDNDEPIYNVYRKVINGELL